MTREEIVDELAGTSVQIVYEYEDWSCAHVSDMYEACNEGMDGEPVEWDCHQLGHACDIAQSAKDHGYDYFAAIEHVKKTLS